MVSYDNNSWWARSLEILEELAFQLARGLLRWSYGLQQKSFMGINSIRLLSETEDSTSQVTITTTFDSDSSLSFSIWMSVTDIFLSILRWSVVLRRRCPQKSWYPYAQYR